MCVKMSDAVVRVAARGQVTSQGQSGMEVTFDVIDPKTGSKKRVRITAPGGHLPDDDTLESIAVCALHGVEAPAGLKVEVM